MTRVMSVILALIASTHPRPAAADEQGVVLDKRMPTESLVRGWLQASGVDDPAALDRLSAKLEREVRSITRRASHRHDPYRRAEALHRLAHARLFKKYELRAHGLRDLLEDGSYNCVSASLVLGLAARESGFDVGVIESGHHLILRLSAQGQTIDVESVSSTRFDISKDIDRFGSIMVALDLVTAEELKQYGAKALFEQFNRFEAPVSLEKATAFLWHNTATLASMGGDARGALRGFREKFRIYPELVARTDADAGLSKAYQVACEGGDFRTALEIAWLEAELFPERELMQARMQRFAARWKSAALK